MIARGSSRVSIVTCFTSPKQPPIARKQAHYVEPVECAPGDRQVSVRLGTRVQSQLTETPPGTGSFGCCGTIAALMLSEARRRQAQRYALIGQATEDLDEVPSLDPARLAAAHARSPGRRTLWMWKLRERRRGRRRTTTTMGWTCRDYRRHLLCSHRHLLCSHRSLPCSRRSLLCSHRSLSRRRSRLWWQPSRCAPPRHPPARSPAHGIGLPTLRWPLRWQPDLLDFTLPPTPSVVTPVMTTSENWVAEMESEIREFDQLTAQHMPSSAPGAGWKQSMEEELELHLSKT